MNTTLENKVLGIENEEGEEFKYIVISTKDKRFFVGLNPRGIGGHKDMHRLLEDFAEDRDPSKTLKSLNYTQSVYYETRPILMQVFNEVAKLAKDYLRYDSVKGGKYQFNRNTLKIYGSSQDLGSVPQSVLEEFKEPISQYCQREGYPLEKIEISSEEED